ncbi:MAG: serine/threonine-protein kinase [Sandaracinaceae bacterium]
MDPLIGTELDGRYRLLEAIGEGAMGRVYRAERMDGTGQVAVKVLNEDCTREPDLRERFEREARALFGLTHPNILDVQDYGVIGGQQPYLVMEMLEGQSLDELVDERTLDPAVALDLGRQVLAGLAYAHGLGVLHRDLKTENVFVVQTPDGRYYAKLLDFGLVKFVDDERWGEGRKLTVAGSVMGSPAYMSPEQGTGGQMDARSDVYSAGVVLYELLTGNWPFVADSRVEMLKAHLLEPVPALAAGREGLVARPELDALLRTSMAKEMGEGFADAGLMLAALDAIPAPAARLQSVVPAQAPAGSLPPPPMAQAAVSPIAMAASAPVQAPAAAPIAAPPSAAPASGSKLPLILLGALVGACLVGALLGGLVLLFAP